MRWNQNLPFIHMEKKKYLTSFLTLFLSILDVLLCSFFFFFSLLNASIVFYACSISLWKMNEFNQFHFIYFTQRDRQLRFGRLSTTITSFLCCSKKSKNGKHCSTISPEHFFFLCRVEVFEYECWNIAIFHRRKKTTYYERLLDLGH